MNRILFFLSIAIFSIFLGSQITEGFLLVPYWKTLSRTEFYDYYSKFGTTIGKFYTILTIITVLIPLCTSIYCFFKKQYALKYSLISTFFAFLIIVIFYVYFKDTNQQFYKATFHADQLKSVLGSWEYWHWLRVLFEFLSLIFLILALNILDQKNNEKYTT
ncbi:hypothetical protein [Aquimarina megaterium]|uniref:hypothetical protein n=1 Tax=Aquimarina megaterium TaxID=1443666 RepID=UPI000945DB52|nr:hypothetical protein [Aquimarina megaterium]